MSNTSIEFSWNLLAQKAHQLAIETRHIPPNNIDPPAVHFHDFYEILYYYQGARRLNVNTIAFVAPYKFHRTSNADHHSRKCILINFTYDFIRDFDDIFDNRLLTCFHAPANTITFSPSRPP